MTTTTTTAADMTATTTDQRPTCCECGSHNVETTAWIDYTADGVARIVPGEGPHGDELGNWCHDCEEHVDLDYPTTTPADDARRQAANAAREYAGDMVQLLQTLTAGRWHESRDLADEYGRAMAAARDLLARLA